MITLIRPQPAAKRVASLLPLAGRLGLVWDTKGNETRVLCPASSQSWASAHSLSGSGMCPAWLGFGRNYLKLAVCFRKSLALSQPVLIRQALPEEAWALTCHPSLTALARDLGWEQDFHSHMPFRIFELGVI